MSETSPEFSAPAPEWQEEFFYFGNANWPSDATYRTSGERLQLRVELGLQLVKNETTGQYVADTSEVADFLAAYNDCSIVVRDSHKVHGGGRSEPTIWVMGWKELTTEEDRAEYLRDKAMGGKL
jgi:hypothetical protein